MAIIIQSFRNGANAATDSGITMAHPTGIQVGDLLLALMGVESTGAGVITATGWTHFRGVTSAVATAGDILFKIAVAGDIGGSTAFDWSSYGTKEYGGGFILRISGYDSSTPLFDSAPTQGTAVAMKTGALAAPSSSCLPIAFFSFDGADGLPFTPLTTNGWPGSFPSVDQEIGSGGGGQGWGGCWMAYGTERSVATDPCNIDAALVDGYVGFILGVNEAAGAPAPRRIFII